MKKSALFHQKFVDTNTIESISHILESIASIRIQQIKDEVLESREFFLRLWSIYSQLRVSEKDVELDGSDSEKKIDRPAVVLVTANAGLTGEIDSHLVNSTLQEVDTNKADFFVVGKHGESLLRQRGINPKAAFKFPEITEEIDITELTTALRQYDKPVVYYPSYESLSVQRVVSLPLVETVQRLSEEDRELDPSQIISPDKCLFEPSVNEVVKYLEQMMISTTLTEIVLESSLAQLASRFNAMNSASSRAKDMSRDLFKNYVQLKRYESDEANRKYNKRKVRT
ncbi:MAG: F0F1 ATP synthase subunit gamma [Candidatus Saccharibacteria bacterium]